MAYKVIARKWRPQTFDELIGQEHISRTLKNSFINDRVAHSFIFTGLRGVGKTTTARILAKRFNCENPNGGNPCNECKSCVSIMNSRHLDVIEIDGASNTSIEDVKEIREASKYLPSQSKYKIYIVDEVHMLSEKAFNALLKILEEPPKHVKFIFATTEPHKIPITIKSRCQIFDFKGIKINDIYSHLEMILNSENIKFEEEGLYLIAKKARGSMRDSQSLLDQVISFSVDYISKADIVNILGISSSEKLFEITDAIVGHNYEEIILICNELNNSGINLVNFYKELLEHFHNILLVINLENPERLLNIPKFELEKYKIQAQKFDKSFFTLYEMLIKNFDSLKISQFKKITFEMILIKLADYKPVTPLKDILKILDKMSNSIKKNNDFKNIDIDIYSIINNKKIEENIKENKILEVRPNKDEKNSFKHDNKEDKIIKTLVKNKKEIFKDEEKIIDTKEVISKNANEKIVFEKSNIDIQEGEINLKTYKELFLPFFKENDSIYEYFFNQAKIPLIYKNRKFIIFYPLAANQMLELNTNFKDELAKWIKERYSSDLKIEIAKILPNETYEGILENKKNKAKEERINNIKNLENVKNIKKIFNTSLNKIDI